MGEWGLVPDLLQKNMAATAGQSPTFPMVAYCWAAGL